jgi:hypothetical protein
VQLRLLDRLAGTTADAQALDAALADWQRAQTQVGRGPWRLARVGGALVQR